MNSKIITTPTLIALMAITMMVVTTDTAFAESEEELIGLAAQANAVTAEIEILEAIVDRTDAQSITLTNLWLLYETLLTTLNENGVATEEQWNADKDHWSSINEPKDSSKSAHTAQRCACTASLKFISGFSYELFAGWWTGSFSQNGWTYLSGQGANGLSEVVTEEAHDDIEPFVKVKPLAAFSSATVTVDAYGKTYQQYVFYEPPEETFNISWPWTATETFPRASNVGQNYVFTMDLTINSLN